MNGQIETPVRILNCEPSPATESDWAPADAQGAGILAAALQIPPSKDLREPWWKIGDQRSTGSCVGWATADGVLRWHFVQIGRIAKNKRLSARFIWMAAKETDEFRSRPTTFIEMDGTSLKAALDVARKYGAVHEKILPFRSSTLCCDKDAKTFYALASQLKIAGYFNLGRDFAAWREWLAFQGPILARVEVDATWYAATDNQGKLGEYQPTTSQGGHAITLVGYTPEHFIVRNSWGKDWGDDGFGYASLAYADAGMTEAYGISVV